MIILIAPAIAALLPALIATIGGSILSRGQSQGDIRRQNAYNHPVNQVRRLREAGLPFAAMGTNQTGNQSALPETNKGIQETGQAIGNFISTRLQQKQIELIDSQIRKTDEEAQGQGIDNQLKTIDPMFGQPVSYGARMARLDIETRQIQKEILEHQREITYIDRQVKESLHKTGQLTDEIKNRVLLQFRQLKAYDQTYTTNEMKIKAERTLIEQLEKGGMSVEEAFIHLLMSGGIRNFVPMQPGGDK